MTNFRLLDGGGAGSKFAAVCEIHEQERLRVFRRHLAIGIREVSPVVLDLAEMLAAGIDEIAAAFRPRPPWCAAIAAPLAQGTDADRRARSIGRPDAQAPVRLARHDARTGTALSCDFALVGGRIEALALLDGLPIQTCRDRTSVLLPRACDVAAVRVGDAVDGLVPTDPLGGRGYVIDAVYDRFACDRTLITLHTGLRGRRLRLRDAARFMGDMT